MQDYYEILQVHPNADQEAIQAAYERMRQRYDPARLEGAADELLELARQKRDGIERAYAVLGDPVRRAEYDNELRARAAGPDASATEVGEARADTTDDPLLDYRPLPPAHRQERPRSFDTQPVLPRRRNAQRSGRRAKAALPLWFHPATIVGVLTFVVILVSFLVTNGGRPTSVAGETAGGPATLSTPGGVLDESNERQIVDQFEGQIVAARQVAAQAPDNVSAWINLGNALYDSVQVVRERMPDSELYQERLPRWIEASEAYSQALQLDPDNPTVRADLAASLCKYGSGVGDQTYVERGLAEARRAAESGPDDPRALLNLGVCLASTDPPQQQAAIEQWLKVLDLPSAPPGALVEARRLIEEFGQ